MWVKRHKRYFEIDLIKTQSESWFNATYKMSIWFQKHCCKEGVAQFFDLPLPSDKRMNWTLRNLRPFVFEYMFFYYRMFEQRDIALHCVYFRLRAFTSIAVA